MTSTHRRPLPTSWTATWYFFVRKWKNCHVKRLQPLEDIPVLSHADAGILDVTVDGADEVDPHLDLIKGYGRALVREKIVAASSRRLVILVGDEKVMSQLGARGKLPVEVTPFALPLCVSRWLSWAAGQFLIAGQEAGCS
jgi:ribose 5-phosphate isomerase